MQIRNFIYAATVVALTACGGSQTTTQPKAEVVTVKTSDQLVMSTLWFQRSEEARQLFRQSYALATQRMVENLKKVGPDRRPSIIVDIDETVLDNSPYEARLIINGKPFDSESWAEWVKEANAKVLPGAREFLRKAEDLGVDVYYISNRSVELLGPTMENLQKMDLPFANPEHILLKTEDISSKSERRERVKSKSEVILLVGDQLADFSEEIALGMGEDEMHDSGLLDSLDQYFVLLPNPMYGNFESSIYPRDQKLSEAQKVEMRKKALDLRRALK